MKLNGIELTEFEEQIHDIGMIEGTMSALFAVTILMVMVNIFNQGNDSITDAIGWGLIAGCVGIIYIIKKKNLQADD